MHYLYVITNQLNQKKYVGQTIDDKKRWSAHKSFTRQEKPIQYIHRAMAKYGTVNFTYEVIAMCMSPEDANEIEKQLIIQYDSRNPKKGYNVAPGGETPWNLGLPKELNPLTGVPRSKETKRKISEGSIGKIMPPCSDERKKHMSDLYLGRTLPSEWVAKIADNNRGQTRSDEAKLKMSISHIGIHAGEKHPAAKLTWINVNNIRVEYSLGSMTHRALAKKYNISQANISDILNNKIWIK